MRICEIHDFNFVIRLIDENDPNFHQEIGFNTSAPNYEMAIAQALSVGQSILRENQDERSLFMRVVCRMKGKDVERERDFIQQRLESAKKKNMQTIPHNTTKTDNCGWTDAEDIHALSRPNMFEPWG